MSYIKLNCCYISYYHYYHYYHYYFYILVVIITNKLGGISLHSSLSKNVFSCIFNGSVETNPKSNWKWFENGSRDSHLSSDRSTSWANGQHTRHAMWSNACRMFKSKEDAWCLWFQCKQHLPWKTYLRADSLAPFWLQTSSMFPGIVWVLHTATSWDTEPSCEKRVAVCPHNGHSKQGKMMLNLWTWGIPMYTPCSDKPSCRKIAPMMPSLFSHPSISVSQLWTDKDWRCENQWDLGRECRCQRLSPIISDRREGEVRSQCLKGSNAKFWNRQ